MKKLSREYGWVGLGVYLGLSVLDFPLCFLLVRTVGVERIGACSAWVCGTLTTTDRASGDVEHSIASGVKQLIPQAVEDRWHEYRAALKQAERENFGTDQVSEHVEMMGWGVEEADAANRAEASALAPQAPTESEADMGGSGLGTQLALAYAIHKTFIFVRVPLTAAVTPKVVRVLRSWGWNIGKRRSKR